MNLRARVVFVAFLVSTLMWTSCSSTPAPGSPQRENARASILLLARGVSLADEACATLARSKNDAAIAKSCADAYDEARGSLLSAEAGVNAWDPAPGGTSGSKKNDVACAVKHAAESLSKGTQVIQNAGGDLPLALSDALKLAPSIAGICAE